MDPDQSFPGNGVANRTTVLGIGLNGNHGHSERHHPRDGHQLAVRRRG
jgi:hypothetical protein